MQSRRKHISKTTNTVYILQQWVPSVYGLFNMVHYIQYAMTTYRSFQNVNFSCFQQANAAIISPICSLHNKKAVLSVVISDFYFIFLPQCDTSYPIFQRLLTFCVVNFTTFHLWTEILTYSDKNYVGHRGRGWGQLGAKGWTHQLPNKVYDLIKNQRHHSQDDWTLQFNRKSNICTILILRSDFFTSLHSLSA